MNRSENEPRGSSGGGEGEEEGSNVRGRLREAGGGQDHGHRLTREVPPGAHQGRRQGRRSRRIRHRHPREEQDLCHLRKQLLQTVPENCKTRLLDSDCD